MPNNVAELLGIQSRSEYLHNKPDGIDVEVVKEDGKGNGLRTCRLINKNDFIGNYIGRLYESYGNYLLISDASWNQSYIMIHNDYKK